MERVILCEINFRRKIGRVGKVFFAFEVAKIVAQVQLHISSFCKYATRGRVSKQKKRSRRRRRRRDGFVLKVNKVLLLRSMSSHLVSIPLPSTMKRRGTNVSSPRDKKKKKQEKTNLPNKMPIRACECLKKD